MKTARITGPTKVEEVKRNWHLFDVSGKTLGRIASEMAQLLIGKNKPYYARNVDCGDYIVVVNAKDVVVTGKKESQKIYTAYSGYPGGIRSESFKALNERHPEEIIRRAVSGMLPKNKLRDTMLKRLYVYPKAEHPYKDRFTKKA